MVSHFSPISTAFFFLVGTFPYIFHDVIVTISDFTHFPPFPSVFPISPIFPWPAGYSDTPIWEGCGGAERSVWG